MSNDYLSLDSPYHGVSKYIGEGIDPALFSIFINLDTALRNGTAPKNVDMVNDIKESEYLTLIRINHIGMCEEFRYYWYEDGYPNKRICRLEYEVTTW